MIPKLFFELLGSAAAVKTKHRPTPTNPTMVLNEYLFMLYRLSN